MAAEVQYEERILCFFYSFCSSICSVFFFPTLGHFSKFSFFFCYFIAATVVVDVLYWSVVFLFLALWIFVHLRLFSCLNFRYGLFGILVFGMVGRLVV